MKVDSHLEGAPANGSVPVVGRLAPSPTGWLHLGHAFSLLVAFWHARRQNGRLVLRIDDIDQGRAQDQFTNDLISDLSWLGINWDGAPVLSSTRGDHYRKAARSLLESGQAYPCVCSRGDILRAGGAPQQGETEVRYPGTCRGKSPQPDADENDSERNSCLRLMVPEGPRKMHDLLFGNIGQDVQKSVGDFVIERRSGEPAYQLSVVLDDHLDGVTQVVRGRDLLPSTLRQNLVAQGLGLPIPHYLHVPLICDATGRRLAKRENDFSLASLREHGIGPMQIVAWAARCANQDLSPGEAAGRLSAQALVERFESASLVAQDICLPSDISTAFDPATPVIRI